MQTVLGCGLALSLFAPFAGARAGTEKLLYSFTGSTGQNPQGGLVSDKAGNLYGTTESGGTGNYGTLFKLAPNGAEGVLFSFDYSDGARSYAGLVADKAGNLYGTTQQGGSTSAGVVFKLAPDGSETVLHTFLGQSGGDGAFPVAGLIMDKKGNIYGTTQDGGTDDNGVVFKVQGTVLKPCSIPLSAVTADGLTAA
ncbi:MAG TPA: choice-of-anchor tandem repeat GloVer-containing protein [Rhizomicrobium sp.]|jgi:uncharacterized repeat protein (TIGR03803 family)|nr:choice-of-anchor tandem repeat GloVer-containing protein [Rhizomicrobium sp.]